MPFKSNAQRKLMFAKHPKIAKKWAKEFPNQGKLPEHVGDKSGQGTGRKSVNSL